MDLPNINPDGKALVLSDVDIASRIEAHLDVPTMERLTVRVNVGQVHCDVAPSYCGIERKESVV